MYLTVLTKDQCEQIRQWRNQNISRYRTSFLLTKEMQEDFYKDVICNKNSKHRYWAIIEFQFLGIVGLTDISLENRNAEISLVINPEERKQNYGEQALELIFEEGFNKINLDNIYGECYYCNEAIKFWEKMILKYDAIEANLQNRKYWNGQYYNSLYFNFNKEKWMIKKRS